MSGREDYWFVYNGTAAFTVFAAWVEAESLAAWVFKKELIYPVVGSVSQLKPHPSAPRQFYAEGIASHYVYEISADVQTVSMVQRGGGSLNQPREEQYRLSCLRK
jgi:hypothetical protein